ncbi:MAG TPA: hypothetical protein VMT58_09375 [Candidatus Binataceae bacterium]|nr:hypothetical protein [Candidatus Binataceae bacterium]
MNRRVLGIYREPEFSPGKVEADAAILDSVLAELAGEGFETVTMDAESFAAGAAARADLILAMCQGRTALWRLAEAERSSVLSINSALGIRNCYRDLMASGLAHARVPIPAGGLVATSEKLDTCKLPGVDFNAGVFVKRGDLHALGPGDVRRADDRAEVAAILAHFARNAVPLAYVQQEVIGRVVKFYGVSGGGYFTALSDGEEISDTIIRSLAKAASDAAAALGLEAWGGDAIVSDESFAIIDFNDWPSYSRVRAPAARAIARRAIALLWRRYSRA